MGAIVARFSIDVMMLDVSRRRLAIQTTTVWSLRRPTERTRKKKRKLATLPREPSFPAASTESEFPEVWGAEEQEQRTRQRRPPDPARVDSVSEKEEGKNEGSNSLSLLSPTNALVPSSSFRGRPPLVSSPGARRRGFDSRRRGASDALALARRDRPTALSSSDLTARFFCAPLMVYLLRCFFFFFFFFVSSCVSFFRSRVRSFVRSR
jgi:hypothetical protein